MPLPLIPLIAAGSSLLGQGINAASQGSMNRKTRDFQREMYERQRVDSLNDWQMQNVYNSPAEQMKRFTEAGLNPNLIYGSANNTTATVRSSTPGTWNPQPSNLDLSQVGGALMDIYDARMKQAQTNNLEQQLETSKQQTLLTAAQTANTLANTGKLSVDTEAGKFHLQQAQKLSDYVLEKAQADLSKTYADTRYTLDANDRAAALQGGNLQQQMENILNSRSQRLTNSVAREQTREQIKQIKNSQVLQKLDIRLKEKGLQPSDPAVIRMISTLLDDDGKGMMRKAQSIIDNIGKGLNDFFYPE